MRRIDQPAASHEQGSNWLSRHRALGRLADCIREEHLDPDEICWALEALSAVVERRLAHDSARLKSRLAADPPPCDLERVQTRLRQSIAKIRERCAAHISEVHMRIGELAEMLAEYDQTVRRFL
ncbi:MAG: hypothetical protein KatS3mg110_4302 [Pirellulaceae bacterium]|nr:MAG: hypothetical protein KatS3mg110_4302 [Pirellulaceae bacterium]